MPSYGQVVAQPPVPAVVFDVAALHGLQLLVGYGQYSLPAPGGSALEHGLFLVSGHAVCFYGFFSAVGAADLEVGTLWSPDHRGRYRTCRLRRYSTLT
jgi:hypothetical protein